MAENDCLCSDASVTAKRVGGEASLIWPGLQ